MNTIVQIHEPDPDRAAVRALHIFEHLGRGFFQQWESMDDDQLVSWISRVLARDALHVTFFDSKEAVLFKLACGGE